MFWMDASEFEAEVGRVLSELPRSITDRIANVAFEVADGYNKPNLLGLYRGVPLTRRTTQYAFALPDMITIYRYPILLRSASLAELRDWVETTVKHEIGHYFGISDTRLHELGWA
jgi:predicted Zn-dependent protease with MMP-like domain